MRIEAETRMKVIGTVWGSHGSLGGGGVAGEIWKKTYPVWLRTAGMVHPDEHKRKNHR